MTSNTSPTDSTVARPVSQGASPRPRNMTHPRKRAVTACAHCRTRKIKCTNERPECRSCVRLGARCSYDQRENHSSFDPASLLILEKLNEVLRRLDGDPDRRSCPTPISNVWKDSNDSGVHATIGSAVGAEHGLEDQLPRALDGLQIPSSYSSTDCVLAWPIFDGQFGQSLLSDELLIAEHASPAHPLKRPADYSGLKRHGICDEDIPVFVVRFLHLVHTKNPILDSRSIRQDATRVAEHGLGWDTSSCLVLLACALGAIAAPFDARTGTLDQEASGPLHVDNDREAAENYYRLACRRLGLLDRSIIAAQCYLLSGIYLMYTIRPLDAQCHFYQSSSIYATHLKGQVALQRRGDSNGQVLESANNRLEQCLYWTCFKSECEIHQELDMPVSELAILAYPLMFPSPPSPASPVELSQSSSCPSISTPLSSSSLQQACQPSTFSTLHQAEEQSWYYYLSEIALRRIGNRVSYYFYKENNESWSRMNVPEAVKIAEDLEVQLENWMSTVPIQLRGNVPWEEGDELRCMIYGRYIDIKGLLYRPFLYYAIHHQNGDLGISQIIDPLAQKALRNIVEITATGSFYHRNHGTWLACRMITTCALLLLGAKKSGLVRDDHVLRDLHWEGDFGHSLQTCLDILRYWESESPEIAKAREVIESLQDRF